MASGFTVTSYKSRVHAGEGALRRLSGELRRLGSRRTMVLSGASVARNSGLIDHIGEMAGDCYAGSSAVLQRHATLDSVNAAVEQLRAHDADCVIAVGGGSALMAARCAVILLAEKAPLEDLITRYPDGQPAISPKLNAPKLPIINVLTAATGAQNRAGSALKVPGFERRLELFDPKTRPAALIWDPRALATAPASLARSSGDAILWAGLMTSAAIDNSNPLAQGDRRQALELAIRALPRIGAEGDGEARLDLCMASYLLNRAEDAGAAAVRANWPMRVCYALASGIFTQDDSQDPGALYLALTRAALNRFSQKEPQVVSYLVKACGEHVGPSRGVDGICDFLERFCSVRTLSDLGVAPASLEAIRDFALQNYNADPHREFLGEREALLGVLTDSM